MKITNRYLVEAIKNARLMQDNVDKFMLSDNKFMRKEYDKLRKQVLRVLREIRALQVDSKPVSHISKLESIKSDLKSEDILTNGSLDNLIRKNHITIEMGSSLANDSKHVSNICENLIDAALLLYTNQDSILKGLPEENKNRRKKRNN